MFRETGASYCFKTINLSFADGTVKQQLLKQLHRSLLRTRRYLFGNSGDSSIQMKGMECCNESISSKLVASKVDNLRIGSSEELISLTLVISES